VGDKTARKLLGQYGSLENIYSSLSELSPALKGRFLEHQDTAWRSRDLVTLSVKEALTLEELLPRSADEKELRDLCSRLGMERFSAKILAPRNASSGKELREAPFGHPAPKDEKTGEEKSGLKTRSLSGEVDKPSLSNGFSGRIVPRGRAGCPLVSRERRLFPWHVSYAVSRFQGRALLVRIPRKRRFLYPLSEWAQKGTLLTLRYKTLCSILRGKVTLSPERVWDAETSLYLLHPDRASASLRDILKNQGVLTDAAPSAVTEALWRTRSIIQPQLEEFGLEQLQRSIDLPLCPVLVDMEQHGLGVHKTGFLELEMDLQRRIDVIEEELAQNAVHR
jgi:DNA polymerase-1